MIAVLIQLKTTLFVPKHPFGLPLSFATGNKNNEGNPKQSGLQIFFNGWREKCTT
jgi:hypothetical protein